jgi:hypothetical protein
LSAAIAVSALSTTIRVRRDYAPGPDYGPFRETLSNTAVLVDWRYLGAALRAGLHPTVNDPYFMTLATRNEAFPIDRLVDDLRAGRIAGLILAGSLDGPVGDWPTEAAAEFRLRFEPAGQAGKSFLYRLRQQ